MTVSSHRRRWFQFSLRTLLILVTLLIGLLVAWRVYVEPFRRQREVMDLIEKMGGTYRTQAGDKWLRWLYGDDFLNVVLVDLADCDDPGAYVDRVASLPRLETLVVGGPNFNDKHLARLQGLDTLCGLVLDSTNATHNGIARLKQTLPDVAVHRSQRRAIAAIGELANVLKTRPCAVVLPALRGRIGNEHFEEAVHVDVTNAGEDARLVHLKALTTLELLELGDTAVTDVRLKTLRESGLLHVLRRAKTKDGGRPRKPEEVDSLDLTYTQVTDEGLKELKDLKALTWLYLNGRMVTDLGLKTLREIGLLHALSRARAKDYLTARPSHVDQIDSLNLIGTQVTHEGLKELKHLRALTRLYLNESAVTDLSLKTLKEIGLFHTLSLARAKGRLTARPRNIDEIDSLDFVGTQVTDEGLKEFKDLKALTSLCLNDTAVTDLGLKTLKHFKGLTKLDLSSTKVTDAGLKELAELKLLRTLRLNSTWVTDAGLKELKRLEGLASIDVGGTFVTDVGLKMLRNALPRCEIRR